MLLSWFLFTIHVTRRELIALGKDNDIMESHRVGAVGNHFTTDVIIIGQCNL